MRKFLTISVCMLASLMANAGVKVTKCSDNATDSVVIDGTFTDADLANIKVGSSVKIAMGSYEISESEWASLCDKLITNTVYTIDMSEARFGYTLTRENFGGKLTNWGNNNVKNITFSRYADIPSSCLSDNSSVETITIPNKKSLSSNESIAIGENAFASMKRLNTLYIGSCVTSIGERICECSGANSSILSRVTFNTPEIKELPCGCFQWCDKLTKVDLPSNLQVVGSNAFAHCALPTVMFPNTLTTIKENAFMECKLEYIVIPENVTLIESFAFQGNANLKDVYVMGTDVKCKANGFTNLQVCNGFVNKTTGYSEKEPSTSSADWDKAGQSIARLHFVAENATTFQKYENPYWIMLNTDGILDELKNLNKDEKGAQEAFIKKYNLHKEFPWSLWEYATGASTECPYAYYQYKDNDGKLKTCKIWRKEGGYYSDADNMNPDYAGWQMFMIIQDDAKQNTFDDSHRVDDRWYSMCFPFDLNANQIRTAYGAGTEVCEFIGAWKTSEVDDKDEEILCFRYKPLLDDVETEYINNTNVDSRESSPIITYANHPYMIHPASKKEGDNTNVWHRIIPGIPMDQQVGNQANLIKVIPYNNRNELMEKFGDEDSEMCEGYTFVGNYDNGVKLPASSYYFAYRDHADGTRSLILNRLTKESKNAWTPMTALVLENQTASQSAKKFVYNFSPIKKGNETTGIKNISANASSQKEANANKIFNLNGQVVKEGNSLAGLGKGIYIMNGRKYIVK